MGREKMPVYLYDTDGKYIRPFESIREFAETFGLSKNILCYGRVHEDIYQFEDGRIACTYKIGREGIRQYKIRVNNLFLGKGSKIAETVYTEQNKGKVVVKDLDGNKLAVFKNIFVAKTMLGTTLDNLELDNPIRSGIFGGVLVKVKPIN